jgi:PEP-CTERM motif-containing protein
MHARAPVRTRLDEKKNATGALTRKALREWQQRSKGDLAMLRKILVSAVLIAGSASANASLLFSENFDDISALGAAGWLAGNLGTGGATADTWFQGNSGIFDAQAGAADSYVASNYLSAGFGGNVDNWLVTPLISAFSGSVVTFSTRTAGGLPGDNLELLYNNIGNGDIVSNFVSLGVISSAEYPIDWQAFNFTYGGADGNVRFAFRYTVNDTSVNGDYIGIDSLSVSVPEPGTMLLLGSCLLMMPLALRRRRREQR